MSTVQVCSRPRMPPYLVQSYENGRWVNLPGDWRTAEDARHHAESATGVWGPSTTFRVISIHDLVRPQRERELVISLKTYELERRGIVRVGDRLSAATDDELDQMWAPRGRAARARAAAQPQPTAPTRDPKPAIGMLRILRLEFIGHDLWTALKIPKLRPWVAGINLEMDVSVSETRVRVVDRMFADSSTDYAEADKTGASGVRLCYCLQQGYVYEAFDRARTIGPRRVFVIHDGTCWHDLTPEEAFYAQGFARRRRVHRSP